MLMTIRDYIKAIKSVKTFKQSQVKLLCQLFVCAGAPEKDVQENTVNSWLKPLESPSHRNCRVKEYFPNDKIQETDFIKFFRTRTKVDWQKLQNAFRQIKESAETEYENFMVDIATDNSEVFYRSLMNQFLTIFNLPVTEEPEKPKEPELLESDNPLESTVDNLPQNIFTSDSAKIRQMRPKLAKLLEIMGRSDDFRRDISFRIPSTLLDCLKEVFVEIINAVFIEEEVREAIKTFEMKYHDYTEYVETHTCEYETEHLSFRRILPIPARNGIQMKDYGGVAYERILNEIKQRRIDLMQAVYKIAKLGDEDR